ncbi:MAG: hypothetical protein WAP74_03250 [Patescibacteria group bacterium]
MRNFLVIIFVLAVFLFTTFAFAEEYLREDRVCDNSVSPDLFLVGAATDLTADYKPNRFVTFSHNNHSTSYKIGSSTYEVADQSDCLGASTYVRPVSGVSFPTIIQAVQVRLWENNPIDTTPPTITNLTAGSITQTGATITWTTNESATHTIKYGTTSGSYDSYPNTKSAGTGASASGAL